MSSIYIYPININEYIIGKDIAKGCSSIIYEGIVKETGEHVALKIINTKKKGISIASVIQELQIMGTIDHPNLLKMHCYFLDNHRVIMVMPLFLCSLHDIIKQTYPNGIKNEILLATILKEILQGIKYIHDNNKIHRDIKGQNILLSKKGDIKITDYGISKIISEHKPKPSTFCGTLNWMAPEIIDTCINIYDNKVDIWSFGITAIELAYGKPFYHNFSQLKVMFTILQNPVPTKNEYDDEFSVFSEHFHNMIKTCLIKKSTLRPNATKLLSHRFFNQAVDKKYIGDILLK